MTFVRRHIRAILAAVMTMVSLCAHAQELPTYGSTYINDWANVMTPENEQRLTDDIARLRGDTGVEIVVVTMESKSQYGWRELEPFATAIFNDWGVGDAQRNDGIMVLVLTGDREIRIELGRGYGPGFDRVAQSVVDTDFLPHFRAGRYEDAVMDGTSAVINEIALPFAQGTAPEAPGFWEKYRTPTIVGGFLLAILGLGQRQRLGDFLTRFRRCPTCGQRKLHVTRETTIPATKDNDGHAIQHTVCTNCDWSASNRYRIRHSSGRSGGSFGGGSSSGGGASGRW